MLKKAERLKTRQVDSLFAGNRPFTLRNKDFRVFVYNNFPQNAFAVTVSKKVFKRAVDRNRVRRLFYEAIRLSQKAFKNKAIMINIQSKDVLSKKTNDILPEVQKLFNEIH